MFKSIIISVRIRCIIMNVIKAESKTVTPLGIINDHALVRYLFNNPIIVKLLEFDII